MANDVAIKETELDVQRIMGEVLPEIEDSEAAQRAIVERILASDTLEETFRSATTIATRELVGKPIAIRDCRWMRSDIEDARGVYMLLDCADLQTGEVFVANTGSPTVLAIVWANKQHGRLPIEVKVVEAAAAKPGRNAPLTLEPVGKTLSQIGSERQPA